MTDLEQYFNTSLVLCSSVLYFQSVGKAWHVLDLHYLDAPYSSVIGYIHSKILPCHAAAKSKLSTHLPLI